jgi:hypothetical protein
MGTDGPASVSVITKGRDRVWVKEVIGEQREKKDQSRGVMIMTYGVRGSLVRLLGRPPDRGGKGTIIYRVYMYRVRYRL